jgi:hypothetical protein
LRSRHDTPAASPRSSIAAVADDMARHAAGFAQRETRRHVDSVCWRTDGNADMSQCSGWKPRAEPCARLDRRSAMRPFPIFHDAARTVRFWVPVNGTSVCAMVSDATLRCCFAPAQPGRTALSIFGAHLAELDEMVRRKIAAGFLEPVMLHDSDFPADAASIAGASITLPEATRPAS